MVVSEANPSEYKVLRQYITELDIKNAKTKIKKADIEGMYIKLLEQIREEYIRHDVKKAEFKVRIRKIKQILLLRMLNLELEL